MTNLNEHKRETVREALENSRSNGYAYPKDAASLMATLREHGSIDYDDNTPEAMSWFQAVSKVLEQEGTIEQRLEEVLAEEIGSEAIKEMFNGEWEFGPEFLQKLGVYIMRERARKYREGWKDGLN